MENFEVSKQVAKIPIIETQVIEIINSGSGLTPEQQTLLNEIPNIKIDLDTKADANNVPTNTQFNNHVNNTNNPHSTGIDNLTDTTIINPTDKQLIGYDISTSKWINQDAVDEKVKINSLSTSKYLGEWLDGVSIQNIGGKLVCKSLDGMDITLLELNRLSGLDKNIMDYLTVISNPMRVRGVVDTYADLNIITSPVDGNVAIVRVDVNNLNKQMTYIYYNNSWTSMGECDIHVRDFLADKLDLTLEVKNKLPQVNIDMTDIVKAVDLANYETISDLQANYATITQVGLKANSTDVYNTTQSDSLLNNKVDKVTNKSLISDSEIARLSSVTNYDHTNVDTHMANNDIHVTSTDKTNLANAVTSSHTHSNKAVIDKFTEVGGQPYYNGSAIGSGTGGSTYFAEEW